VPQEVIARMVAEEGAKLRLLVIDEETGRLLHRAHDAYRPTPAQIAQIRAEYVHSVGPGSQVLASRTDTDHAIEHPDGRTVIGNLIPNDRTWPAAIPRSSSPSPSTAVVRFPGPVCSASHAQ
jgi:hypothetical protein